MSVQPSSVMHWNTVSMAWPKLSKQVIPHWGPSQYSRHSYSSSQLYRPPQGLGSSIISPETRMWRSLHGVYLTFQRLQMVDIQTNDSSNIKIRNFIQKGSINHSFIEVILSPLRLPCIPGNKASFVKKLTTKGE